MEKVKVFFYKSPLEKYNLHCVINKTNANSTWRLLGHLELTVSPAGRGEISNGQTRCAPAVSFPYFVKFSGKEYSGFIPVDFNSDIEQESHSLSIDEFKGKMSFLDFKEYFKGLNLPLEKWVKEREEVLKVKPYIFDANAQATYQTQSAYGYSFVLRDGVAFACNPYSESAIRRNANLVSETIGYPVAKSKRFGPI